MIEWNVSHERCWTARGVIARVGTMNEGANFAQIVNYQNEIKIPTLY